MIVPASPIVPRDDDRGVCPIRAIANRVDNRCYPGRSAAVVAFGVIGMGTIGDDPAHLLELAVGDVLQNLPFRDDHIVGPIRAGAGERAVDGLRQADVVNGVGRGPDGASRGSIVAPGYTLSIQQIGEGCVFETGVLRRGLSARRVD